MRLAAVLVGALALLSYAFQFAVARRLPGGPAEHFQITAFAFQSHLAVFTMVALVGLGLAAPNPWIGLLLGWIGCTMPLVILAWARGWIPAAAGGPAQSTSQMMVVGWGALYVSLGRLLDAPRDLPWWAVGLIGWAAFNGWMYASQRWGWWRPPWMTHQRIVQGGADMGFLDNGSELAWLMGSASLAAVYLALRWHPVCWALVLLFAVCLSRVHNESSWLAMSAGAATFAGVWWPWLGGALAVSLGLLGLWLVLRCLRYREARLMQRLANWRPAVQQIWHNRGLGMGLGIWTNHQVLQTADGRPQHAWTSLHNDWLQGMMEVGVGPALCALAYLVTTWMALPATPEAAYAFAVVASVAVFGCLYYPLRVPHQAFMLVVAMAALR